ncbi:hypothetical protein ACFV6D_31030 [Kitasatospora sp. NPDC059812]|uniref:hypothetical protein n=1 Tax=Kitasatospora sp. NPDC059812 TaxID=3346958 RepID=UPI0036465C73
MMPAEPTTAPAREEPINTPSVPATKVTVTQESAPIGPANDPGFHLFTVSLRVTEPKDAQWDKQTVTCQFKSPTGWEWVDWANYYWYNDQTYAVNGLKTVSPAPPIKDGVLTIELDASLNTTSTDSNRLCFTLLIKPTSGATGTQKDGKATIRVKGQNLLPVECQLWAIVP